MSPEIASICQVFITIFLIYLLFPCKHPCDYNSYKSWWNDRKNW